MHHHSVARVNKWPVEACKDDFEELWLEMLFRITAKLHQHINDGGRAPFVPRPAQRVTRLEAIIYTAQSPVSSLDVPYPEREADDTKRHGLS